MFAREHKNGNHTISNSQKEKKRPFILGREGTNADRFVRDAQGTIIQMKTELGGVNDPSEREADTIADQVVEKQGNRNDVQSSEEESVQMKPASNQISPVRSKPNASTPVDPSFQSQLNETKGGGSEMSNETRGEMESGFGTDFKNVRIHADQKANEMSQSIGAKAFTQGNDIYFNSGQYQPGSKQGKKLLAHELTHTIQQKGTNSNSIQRSEVDGSAGGNLEDSASLINAHVNETLESIRSEFEDLSSYENRSAFVKKVFKKIGAMSDILEYQSKIEVWVEKELEEGKYWKIPYSQNTKYANVKENFGFWKTFKVLGPTMLVAGTRIGSDKLGHFFHEGFEYYEDIKKYIDTHEGYNPYQRSTWGGWETMQDYYHDLETGKQGTGTTGVYSFADLAANYAGFSFYIDLLIDPNMKFDVKSYMGEHITPSEGSDGKGYDSSNTRSHWSEETNNNMYRRSVGRYVWANILGDNQWVSESSTSNYTNANLSFYVGSDESNTKITFVGNNVDQISEEYSGKRIPISLREGNPFEKITTEDRAKPKYDIIDGVSISGELKDKEKNTAQIFIESLSEYQLTVTLTKSGESPQTWKFNRV